MSNLDNTKMKQLFFLLLIFGMGYLLAIKLVDYLSGFLGALILYVLFRKFNHYLIHEKNWPTWLSALTIILIATMAILLPAIGVAQIALDRITALVINPEIAIEKAQNALINIKNATGIDFLSSDTVNNLQNVITNKLPVLLGGTFMAGVNILLMYFILYFLLTSGKKLENFAAQHLPLRDENILLVGRKSRDLIISYTLVIPVLGIIQAGFALLGYWVFGVSDMYIYALLTGVASIIPIVGTMIIWLPLMFVLIADNQIGHGVGLGLYGFIVIANADNFFRFILQKKIANVHPLITIFGVILGVQLFGFVGLIFGPILISLFILMLELYRQEFVSAPAGNSSGGNQTPTF
jgi:predicted PurR-regulated permease PerM